MQNARIHPNFQVISVTTFRLSEPGSRVIKVAEPPPINYLVWKYRKISWERGDETPGNRRPPRERQFEPRQEMKPAQIWLIVRTPSVRDL